MRFKCPSREATGSHSSAGNLPAAFCRVSATSNSIEATGELSRNYKTSLFKTTVNRSREGGGRYLTKFNSGRLRPEVQPFTFLTEKVPILTFIEKKYPFHILTFRSLVLIFM